MFNKVNETQITTEAYTRFSEIKVVNPVKGQPIITVTIDKYLLGVGVIETKTVVLDQVPELDEIGFDGKQTGNVLTASQIAIVLNSVCHQAMNQPDPVDYVIPQVSIGDRLLGD